MGSVPSTSTSNSSSSLPLHIEGLTKRFGDLTAVNDVSLELNSGECLGLLGPNGAGKTTLIRSIVGRVIPDVGTVSIFGFAADSTRGENVSGMGATGIGALSAVNLTTRTGNRLADITG